MTKTPESLAIGRDVIRREIEGLKALETSLGSNFEKAVNAIHACSGHVIVVGIGKSGHIGRKIAASFASTGTPAFFLHPSEAAHGDLGMIMSDSLVMGLSNSGESSEVNGVMSYAKSHGNATLAITSVPNSTLAKSVDIALILPEAEEACPNNLAPTTSTTLAWPWLADLKEGLRQLSRISKRTPTSSIPLASPSSAPQKLIGPSPRFWTDYLD